MNHRIAFFAPIVLVVLAPTARSQPAQNESPRAAYARSFIGFDDEYDYDVQANRTGPFVTGVIREHRRPVPFRGIDREPLEPAEFYDAVERPDLAEASRTRGDIRVAGLVGGIAASAIGVYFAYRGASVDASPPPDTCDVTQPGFDACWNAWRQRTDDKQAAADAETMQDFGIAFGALVVAGVGAAIYRYVDENPVDEGARHRLAREHNQRLKQTLGLPDDFELAPYATPNGGGLTLGGRF